MYRDCCRPLESLDILCLPLLQKEGLKRVRREIKEEFIIKLNIFGKLYYYKEFPRPFFKIKIQNGSEILGVQGECSFRVVYCKKCKEIYKDFFENDLEIILNDIKK